MERSSTLTARHGFRSAWTAVGRGQRCFESGLEGEHLVLRCGSCQRGLDVENRRAKKTICVWLSWGARSMSAARRSRFLRDDRAKLAWVAGVRPGAGLPTGGSRGERLPADARPRGGRGTALRSRPACLAPRG